MANWTEVRFRASPTQVRVVFYVRYWTDQIGDASAALEEMHQRYGEKLEPLLPPGTTVNWDAGAANPRSDYADVTKAGGGYLEQDPSECAVWASEVAGSWLGLLLNDPIQTGGPQELEDDTV